jgi:hypothetical protein
MHPNRNEELIQSNKSQLLSMHPNRNEELIATSEAFPHIAPHRSLIDSLP